MWARRLRATSGDLGDGMNQEAGSTPEAQNLPGCYRHPDRETGIRCTRCERPICPECMVTASVGFHCPECVREGQRSMRPVKTMYGGRARGGRSEITKLLVGVNVVIFLVTLSSGASIGGSG